MSLAFSALFYSLTVTKAGRKASRNERKICLDWRSLLPESAQVVISVKERVKALGRRADEGSLKPLVRDGQEGREETVEETFTCALSRCASGDAGRRAGSGLS
jgi:hypothetical protein